MIYVVKIHYAGSNTYQLQAVEYFDPITSEEIARKSIEGYGVGDIDHVEVSRIDDSAFRDTISFDVKTVLENKSS